MQRGLFGYMKGKGEGEGEEKKGAVVDVFKGGNLQMLAVYETNIKGSEEFVLEGVNGICSGMDRVGKDNEEVSVSMTKE